jgi:hypothetical protein
MSPFALLSLLRGRGSLYGLLGLVLLSTLWVSSLTLLSSPDNSKELLTDVGVQVLNPFLEQQNLGSGVLGITKDEYNALQTQASQHKDQPIPLPSIFKVQVFGRDIVNKSYDDGLRAIYGDTATAYYNGGLGAAFTLPAELQQIVQYFGVFGSAAAPAGVPSTAGLPDFLQPFFTVIGLTPATFTATGHDNLLHLLPWFWLATIVLGAVAVLFNRGGNQLSGLAKTVVHSAWPIVLVLVGVWAASLTIYKATLAPYGSALGVVDRAFLPVYGGALVVGALGLVVPKLFGARQQSQQQQAPAGDAAMAGVMARAQSQMSAMPSMPSTPSTPSMPWASPADAAPPELPGTFGQALSDSSRSFEQAQNDAPEQSSEQQ